MLTNLRAGTRLLADASRFGVAALTGVWLSIALLIPTARAQDEPATTISVNVKVVNVLATVRDKRGNIINDLTQDDFTLAEDGRPQTIKYFARETDLPLSLGLLVDTSGSQLSVLDDEKSASATFVNSVLREQDSSFLLHFDGEAELLQDVTQSRSRMVAALRELGPSEDYGRWGRGRGGVSRSGAGTVLYDAIFLAADDVMKPQTGRKAIIVLTDGVDHGSQVSLERAIEAAQRADTIVYSVYYEGEEGNRMVFGGGRRHGGWSWPMPGGGGSSSDGKRVLERLSHETGGRMFVVSHGTPIGQIYRQIEDELRNQYNLGYTPDRATAAEYRHILVGTKRSDLTVQSRDGYYASRPVTAEGGSR
jgi:VWFA-related protein